MKVLGPLAASVASGVAWAGHYPREFGAVRLSERGYPAQRPRAHRGLPPHDHDGGESVQQPQVEIALACR